MKNWAHDLSALEETLLQCFFPEGDEKTIKILLERSGYSYERVYNSLKKLIKMKLITETRVGKTLLYKLDFNAIYNRLAFFHYMLEKQIYFSNKHYIIFKALKEIEEVGIVILFGSYSKGKETKESDIDIMIVSDKEISLKPLNLKYGLNIKPVFIKKSEFPKIKKQNPELWNDIRMNGIIFQGLEWYYHWGYI